MTIPISTRVKVRCHIHDQTAQATKVSVKLANSYRLLLAAPNDYVEQTSSKLGLVICEYRRRVEGGIWAKLPQIGLPLPPKFAVIGYDQVVTELDPVDHTAK